ncbi:MAG TPA: hypothetical protein VEW03_01650, partial [Longimicrobiaceae bacterium]|nr:hypothetical protein [Longimicrobiaceae bacterium]
MRSKRWSALAGLAVLLAGCGKSGEAAPAAIARERFVAANVAVRTATDSTQAGRDSALRLTGVTAAQLHAFVNAHARDPLYLSGVWMEVADSVEKVDTQRRRLEEARAGPPDSAEAEVAIPPAPDPATGALIIPPPPQPPSVGGPPGARSKPGVQVPDTVRPLPLPLHRPPQGPP